MHDIRFHRHREPPLGGVAIQARRTARARWIAASLALLAMTKVRINAGWYDPVML